MFSDIRRKTSETYKPNVIPKEQTIGHLIEKPPNILLSITFDMEALQIGARLKKDSAGWFSRNQSLDYIVKSISYYLVGLAPHKQNYQLVHIPYLIPIFTSSLQVVGEYVLPQTPIHFTLSNISMGQVSYSSFHHPLTEAHQLLSLLPSLVPVAFDLSYG